MNKTIAAVSTPPGAGGIAVIRISGDNAVDIADKVYSGKMRLTEAQTHTIHYGYIVDENGEKIDEVLVSVMLAPRTFTAEDTVEINTHGGVIVTSRVLDAVIKAGAFPAEPGEFTKRAFLNGRIDLSKAEAVIDIITADNAIAGKNALKQLEGALSEGINNLGERLISLLARMQVAIDYPDEDLEDITTEEIGVELRSVLDEVRTLISGAENGRIIKEGIKAAIVGKPNVGKSSLLNSLAGEERAIVTDIAGTTRDVIEEYVSVCGVPLQLMDTAGIRDTDDTVEKLGVEKSKKSIDEADLVIVVLDGCNGLEEEDKEILSGTRKKNRIILVNKTDISGGKFTEEVRSRAAGSHVLEISAKTGAGIDEFSKLISKMYNIGEISASRRSVITNARHKAALVNAAEALVNAVNAIDAGIPQDMASIDINIACEFLGEITGITVTEEVVDSIFHNFCVGK